MYFVVRDLNKTFSRKPPLLFNQNYMNMGSDVRIVWQLDLCIIPLIRTRSIKTKTDTQIKDEKKIHGILNSNIMLIYSTLIFGLGIKR